MKGTVKNRWVHGFIIATFVILYFMVSIISTIHVIDFFELSNPRWLAISLAVAFEIGAAASLAAIIILEKTSRVMVWSLFLILTAMQAMGNTYYAFINLADFQGWIELFGLVESEPLVQKRILSIVSGAILPIVALGFIKSLVDYIRPEEPQKTPYVEDGYIDYLGSESKKKETSLEEVIEEDNIIEEVVQEGINTFGEDNTKEPSELLKQRVKENQSKLVKLKDLVMEPPVEVEEIEPPIEVEVVIEEPPVEVEEIEPPLDVEPVTENGKLRGKVQPIEPNTRSISQPHINPTITEETKDAKLPKGGEFNSLTKIGKDWLID